MNILLLISAVAFGSAQPADLPVGPLANPLRAVATEPVTGEEFDFEIDSIKPLDLDLADVKEGAELKVRAARLKLSLPF